MPNDPRAELLEAINRRVEEMAEAAILRSDAATGTADDQTYSREFADAADRMLRGGKEPCRWAGTTARRRAGRPRVAHDRT